MKNEYLSTGFQNVDGATQQNAYFICLKFLDSLPYYKTCKRRSYALLALKPGMTVLEAGCGLGDDAIRIAKRIAPQGKVIGLDASAAMIKKATSRKSTAHLPVIFQTGDIQALPFPDDSFSRCRVDRVLQHIPRPQTAMNELVRVLEPEGLLLAYDNDWDTFSIVSGNASVSRHIEKIWSFSFANRRIGFDLPRLFLEAGLSDMKIYPATSIIADFETADKVYNLRETVQKAMEQNAITSTQAKDWIDELRRQTDEGRFLATLTAYTVIGRKAVKP